MILNDLLKHPLIKLCGMVAVLYFALFANTENPGSLGNKISKERIQENYRAAREKKQFITKNLNAAQKAAIENKSKDVVKTAKHSAITCGDEVTADYAIYKADQHIHTVKNEKFIIGSQNNWLIEENLLGLKTGDTATINLLDNAHNKTPLPKEEQLNYHVTITQVVQGTSNIKLSCK